MNKGIEIRCNDYVNHPYVLVRDALVKDPLAVFQSATNAASSRAKAIASELRMDIGGIGIETSINITVKNIEETRPRQRLPKLSWISLDFTNHRWVP